MVIRAEYLDAGTDRELVARFQEGDESAFVELVHHHYQSLLAQAQRRLRTRCDAEDAVQETLLRAYRALPRFGGEYHLRAWLGRILANTCNDVGQQRQAASRLEHRLASVPAVDPPADDRLPDEKVLNAVRAALTDLPATQSRAFLLREFDDQTYSEVAEAMSISEVNARARVHRARSALQRSLRSVSGALGAFLLPLPLGSRLAQALSGRLARQGGGLASLRPSDGGASAGRFASALPSSVSTAPSLPVVGQLSGVSQLATQVAAVPAVQSVVGSLPDVARSSVGALATLAAASIAIVVPSASSGPAQAPTAAPQAVSLAPVSGSLVPTTEDTTPPPAAPTSGTSAQTTSSPGPASQGSSNSNWQWVQSASTESPGSSGSATQDATPTTDQGESSTSTQSGPAAATPVDAPACPWLQTFPDQAPSGDPLPPASFSNASAYLSGGSIALSTTGPIVSGGAPFTVSNGQTSSTVNMLFGACLAGAQTQALVATVTAHGTDGSVQQWQLRGAFVSSAVNGVATDTYFRGTVLAVGADAASAVPFVADMTVMEPANTASLHIAILGAVPGLTDPSGATSSTSSGSTTTATGTGSPTSDGPKNVQGPAAAGTTTSG